ncbi:hypothetical protein JCM15831A_24200 [Asaia astilbis]
MIIILFTEFSNEEFVNAMLLTNNFFEQLTNCNDKDFDEFGVDKDFMTQDLR